jgi:hypothetical protein
MHTRTIVCGVDGLPGGRAAVRVAASLANQFGVRLVAVHVLDRTTLEEPAVRTVPAAARASAPIVVPSTARRRGLPRPRRRLSSHT